MSDRRTRGTGTIEGPDRNGKYRARLGRRGRRLRPCDTYEAAAATLDAAIEAIGAGVAICVGDDTLVGFGLEVLDQREKIGRRDVGTERSRWRTHVEPAFVGRKLTAIKRADAIAWRDEMLTKRASAGKWHKSKPDRRLGRTTIQNTMNLVRQVYDVALDRGLVKVNPFTGVKLPRGNGATHDPWTYLLPVEQRALLVCASEPQRLLVAFAMGTGIRESEQWNLRIADVDLDRNRITVRFGSKKGARKNGRILRVPLLPIARAAVERQLELLPAQAKAWEKTHAGQKFNPRGLVWPSVRGDGRTKGAPSWWGELVARVGLAPERRHDGRHVRWHDLRHTCASSLVSGWWTDAPWPLERVSKMLGHSSITMTQRYAHLADGELDAAARPAAPQNPPTLGQSPFPWGDLDPEFLSHLRDLNSRPTVYEVSHRPKGPPGFHDVCGALVGLSARAVGALRAIAEGGPDAYRMPTEVLGEVVRAGHAAWAAERRTA